MPALKQEVCVKNSSSKMGIFSIPPCRSSPWSSPMLIFNNDVSRGIPQLPGLPRKSDKKNVLKEWISNIHQDFDKASKESVPAILRRLSGPNQLCLPSPEIGTRNSINSNSSTLSGSKLLPAITLLDGSACKKKCKYFRLIDTSDTTSCQHSKQSATALQKRSLYDVSPIRDAVDSSSARTTALGSRQMLDNTIQNPVTSWVNNVQSHNKDLSKNFLRVFAKKDAYAPKSHPRKEKTANSDISPQSTNFPRRKGRAPRNGDRGSGAEASIPTLKKKQRGRICARSASHDKSSSQKDFTIQKLASEVTISSALTHSETPRAGVTTCCFFHEPKVGFGFGFLGVLNEHGDYVDDESSNSPFSKSFSRFPNEEE